MKEYIMTIAYTCIFSGFVIALSPTSSLTKYLKLTVGLVMLIVTISPVVNIIENISESLDFGGINTEYGNINEIDEKTDLYDEWLEKTTEESLSELIKKEIFENFNTECRVVSDLKYENEVMEIISVDIYITSTQETISNISHYIKHNYSIDVNIINSS